MLAPHLRAAGECRACQVFTIWTGLAVLSIMPWIERWTDPPGVSQVRKGEAAYIEVNFESRSVQWVRIWPTFGLLAASATVMDFALIGFSVAIKRAGLPSTFSCLSMES